MKTTFTFLLSILFGVCMAQDKIYVHTATAANTSGHITYIDHPDLNGNSNAGVVYCHNWNPNGASGTFNNNPTGLWYDGNQWTIYHEDASTAMAEGSSFNVYISDPSNVITHVSTAANQGSFGGHTTVIDNGLLNNTNPGPYAVMSTYYNSNNVYNTGNYGFYYDTALSKRGIYEEDSNPIPNNAAFKILVSGDGTVARFTHTATAANIANNWTTIDHSSLNGNPDATFVFNHYWGVTGVPSQVNLGAVLGVWYTGTNWAIYNEAGGGSPMPENIVFDIMVADQEVLAINDITIDNAISIFPNPSINAITIEAKEIINEITIFNLLGQQILSLTEVENNRVELDIASYSVGTYFAKVQLGNTSKALKFIKQ